MTHEECMRLMICDILMATCDDGEKLTIFPVVVDGIDENCTLVDGKCNISWHPLLPEHKDIEYADELEPIPLTEEILKANKFEYRGFTAYESMHYDHSVTVYFNKDREIFMLIGGEQRWMRYVHELQHALRLCGFNDMAENFKIK